MAMRYGRVAAALGLAAAGTYGVYLLACTDGPTYALFVNPAYPEAAASYAQGELGIVQPTFARWYLVEAYRRLNGLSDRRVEPLELAEPPAGDHFGAIDGWLKAREAILNTGQAVSRYSIETSRRVAGFVDIRNCGTDAIRTASNTLSARVAQFGAASAEVGDWLAGQDAVFKNCGDGSDSVVLPPDATTSNALIRADRAYQIACALFYATDYDAAAARFQAIGADPQSPWRKYGSYLSARAQVRKATVTAKTDADIAGAFDAAERTLQSVLDDDTLRDMHPSAKGLLGFVAVQHRPMQRLHELSELLAGRRDDIAWQDMRDYTWLMDEFIGNTVDYQYDTVEDRDQLTANDELTDWIISFQAKGDGALVHAFEKWHAGGSTPWLIAVLWKLPPTHAEADRVLAAAAQVRPDSPAYMTTAFLRVRLLAWMNRREDARRVLADLPSRAGVGVPQGAVNLFLAERLMLASSADAFAAAIARQPTGDYRSGNGDQRFEPPSVRVPSLDRDAAVLMTERMPLDRLADLAESPRIPLRLRVRIGAAAWARSVMLRRDAVGLRMAPVLRNAGPALAANLRTYVAALTAEDRHYAGILTLARTPSLAAYVRESDESGYYGNDPPDLGSPDHQSSYGWWWCGFERSELNGRSGVYQSSAPSVFPQILYGDKLPPFPEFLTVPEQSATNAEFEKLVASGTAPNYLADEAVAWAKARPQDEAAAEALALAIVGTRWGCTDESTGAHSQQAFATLHKVFPNSRWAKQTKYWYKGSY